MLGDGCSEEECGKREECEEEEYDEEDLFLIKEISREEYKEYSRKSIIKTAEDVEINAGIIIKNFPSGELEKLIGSFMDIDTVLSDLGDLMADYFISCSKEEIVEQRRARGEEVQELVYYLDPSGKAQCALGDSKIATYLREVRKNKEEKEEDKIMFA